VDFDTGLLFTLELTYIALKILKKRICLHLEPNTRNACTKARDLEIMLSHIYFLEDGAISYDSNVPCSLMFSVQNKTPSGRQNGLEIERGET